ncbi:sigma-54-dependent Fis family transcriptional regulator [Cryomorphaceae bacterium]|nr:sigma-54-dependent Fis family transcriptional regulator [Cryomorphaceae bacterium]
MKKTDARILVVDDDPDVLTSLKLFLKQHFKTVICEDTPTRITEHLNTDEVDLILLDMNFRAGEDDGREGMYWLNRIVEVRPSSVVILMTAYGEVELAVKAIKHGAFDFILKPFKNEKLLGTLLAGLRMNRTQKEVDQLKTTNQAFSEAQVADQNDFLGESLPMQKVFETIKKVAETDANVLLLGENGTGKEMAARAVHAHSNRKDQPFVSVDLGSLPESLFESELFGHVKGAFTDAKEDKIGRFELAHGGTLFLDEIGNLAPALQAKLLSALQNREITRVGSSKPVKVDIRLVSATNMPLYEMAGKDEFRQDLLYRINTVEVRMPALRERAEDLGLLVDHFMDRFSKRYHKKAPKISKEAWERLKSYRWPGNVRELEHTIERALILHEGDRLETRDLSLSNRTDNAPEHEELNLLAAEGKLIERALEKHQGNISKAAQDLGITRAALYRRMEKHDLQ